MKKTLFILATTLGLGNVAFGQACAGGRFESNIFPTAPTITTDVVYGSNVSFSGSITSLKMDIYQPVGDVSTSRPLIILAHGGSFITGSKIDLDMVAIATDFAKKGYVCASIDYRLGFFPIDSANAVKAVVRAVQDMKASIRFFRADKSGANVYKIDTAKIFIGGSSAGAITALHSAYLKNNCEMLPYMSATTLTALGGLTGVSGNPGYSNAVKGVINLCGALAKYHWLEAGDVPFVSLHGTADGTVKYSRGIVNPGTPLLYLDGSRMLKDRATALSISNPFYTFYGAPHVPYLGTNASAVAYMDTTIKVIRDFLVLQLGCTSTPLQATNAPFGTTNLYAFTQCALAPVSLNEINAATATVYPNPATASMNIRLNNEVTSFTAELVDLYGRTVYSKNAQGNILSIEGENLNGTFMLRIQSNDGSTSVQRVSFTK